MAENQDPKKKEKKEKEAPKSTKRLEDRAFHTMFNSIDKLFGVRGLTIAAVWKDKKGKIRFVLFCPLY